MPQLAPNEGNYVKPFLSSGAPEAFKTWLEHQSSLKGLIGPVLTTNLTSEIVHNGRAVILEGRGFSQ